jgi:hypothetical protein
MQATARRLSVVSATSCARRRLIRSVVPNNYPASMTLAHLNSDQRQYFWMSVFLAGAFAYLALKVDGLHRVFAVSVVALEG